MKIENLHTVTRIKIHWFQKCYSFRSTTKNNEVISRKKTFQNSGVNRRLWRFQHATVLERSIEVGLSLILSIYKVIYISIKDLHAGYAATRWRKLPSNLPKTKLHYAINKTVKMPPITPERLAVVNDARRQYVLPVTITITCNPAILKKNTITWMNCN